MLKTPVILDSSFSHLQSVPSTSFSALSLAILSFIFVSSLLALGIGSLLISLPLLSTFHLWDLLNSLSQFLIWSYIPYKMKCKLSLITKPSKSDFITFLLYVLHYPMNAIMQNLRWLCMPQIFTIPRVPLPCYMSLLCFMFPSPYFLN